LIGPGDKKEPLFLAKILFLNILSCPARKIIKLTELICYSIGNKGERVLN